MLEKLVNVVIDWFKFSINTSFNKNNKIVIDLFKILKLDIDTYDEQTSTGQFEKRLVYDEQTIVLAKPRMDKKMSKEKELMIIFLSIYQVKPAEILNKEGEYGKIYSYLFLNNHFIKLLSNNL